MEVADVMMVAAPVGWIVVDAWLVKTGRKCMTESCRDHPLISGIALLVLAGHIVDRLGRADPFRVAGRVLRR